MIVRVRRRFRRSRRAAIPSPQQVSPRIWQTVLDADYDLRRAFGLWGNPVNAGAWLLASIAVVNGPGGDGQQPDESGLSRLMRFYGWSYRDVWETPYPVLRQAGADMDRLMAEESVQAIADRQGNADYVEHLKAEVGGTRGFASLGEYFAGIC